MSEHYSLGVARDLSWAKGHAVRGVALEQERYDAAVRRLQLLRLRLSGDDLRLVNDALDLLDPEVKLA